MERNTKTTESENQLATFDVKDDCSDSDESCGFKLMCMKSRKKLPFLQRFAKPPWALAALSMVAFLQGVIVNGMINGTLSTLITRFSLTGSQAGLIASSYDIGVCISLLFVTYIGGRGHKPKWLGWGSVLMGIGAIIFSFPHFGASEHKVKADDDGDLCDDNRTSTSPTTCSVNENLRNYRYLFYIAQGIIGVGASPLYTLGITYLDENVAQIKSSFYHGIFYALSIVGPGIGYLLAGMFLNIYTAIGSESPLSSDHSQFVGAWWLGFMIFGFVAFIPSIFVLMLPKQLPGTEQVRLNREKEMHQDSLSNEVAEKEEFGKTLKDFPVSVLVILRNVAFVFVTLAGVADGMITSGLATFLPKIVESLFSISTSTASVIIGIIAIAGGAGGQFLGGLIVTKCDLNVRGIIKFNIVSMLLATLCSGILWKSCPDVAFAGANIEVNGITKLGEITTSCNSRCGCTKEIFDPVCGADNITYFSPCYAGCSNSTGNMFYDCACVSTANQSATLGVCTSQTCGQGGPYVYLIFMFLSLFFTFLVAVPSIQISVRVVPFTQRTFAIGFQWLMIRVLGSIPGPLLYGHLLDLACLVRGDSCGEESSCKVHQNRNISINVLSCTIALKILGLLFMTAVYYFYKPNTELQADNPNVAVTTVENLPLPNGTHKENISSDTSNPTQNNEINQLEGKINQSYTDDTDDKVTTQL